MFQMTFNGSEQGEKQEKKEDIVNNKSQTNFWQFLSYLVVSI